MDTMEYAKQMDACSILEPRDIDVALNEHCIDTPDEWAEAHKLKTFTELYEWLGY